MTPYRRLVGNFIGIPVWFTIIAVVAIWPQVATAQQTPPGASSAFSFAVYGDLRPMMYLPSKEGPAGPHEAVRRDVRPGHAEKIAEAVVKRDVKTIFDPVTGDLIKGHHAVQIEVEVMTLTVDNGWVTKASVEDVKLLRACTPDHIPTCGRRLGGA